MTSPSEPNTDTPSRGATSNTIAYANQVFKASSLVATGCILLLSFLIPQRDTVSVAKVENPQESQLPQGKDIPLARYTVPSYSPQSSSDLQKTLEKYDLWEIDNVKTIEPILFTSFPANLNELTIPDKKTTFFHSLLPVALYANWEVRAERQRLLDLIKNNEHLPKDMSLQEMPAKWHKRLGDVEGQWLVKLGKRYKAETVNQLVKRVHPVPVSLLLAQSALESSWGTSRFAQEGNNLFGIRTWGKKGLVPEGRDVGSKFLVARYDTILDSVRAYILTLNSHHLYVKFRELRLETQDPELLSEGLLYYSEKRQSYVTKVNRIIRYNRLKRFDALNLARYDNGRAVTVTTN